MRNSTLSFFASHDHFYQLGHDWGRDLRDDVANRNQLVRFIRSNLLGVPSDEVTDFRNGFVSAYGVNGEAAFDRAYHQARG